MAEPSNRGHSRQPKIRPCRGCGTVLNSSALHGHESACLRSRVLPGTRFHMKAATMIAGQEGKRRRLRRPIEIEVIRPKGNGWLVRSLHSGREIEVKSPKRFIEWNDFAPGLQQKGAA